MRILCIPHGNVLAHVSRLLEIAKLLRARGHELAFAGSGDALPIVSAEGFDLYPLPEIDFARIVRAIRTTNFREVYGDEDELGEHVAAERRLYAGWNPDLVLSDDRRTAPLSTALAGLPHAAVVNAHVTNHSSLPLRLPRFARTGATPPGWLRLWCRWQACVERTVYATMLGGFRRLYARHGLRCPPGYGLLAGRDLTLVADVPGYTPLIAAPESFRHVGPITWRNPARPIPRLDRFRAYARRAFVVVGSGGFEEVLSNVRQFADTATAYCVAAGKLAARVDPAALPANVWLVPYVNADSLLPHCHAVLCHGGNGTVYQALGHGVPVVCVPSHGEQDYGARRVHQLGLGVRLDQARLRRDLPAVLKIVTRTADDPGINDRVRAFAREMARWPGPENAVAALETRFASPAAAR